MLAERASSLASLLRESEDLVRRAKSEPSGTLRIAAAPVLGEDVLPEIVAELAKRHPRLTIDARMSVKYVDLRRGDADVTLRTVTSLKGSTPQSPLALVWNRFTPTLSVLDVAWVSAFRRGLQKVLRLLTV